MRSTKCRSFFVLTLGLSFGCLQLAAQEVISSQGGSYVSETARVDFTIGEVLVESYSTNLVRYTQGFHQSYVVQLPLGSDEIQPKVSVLIYPNPASDFLKIDIENGRGSRYKLHDLLGRLVGQGALDEASTTVDISKLVDGAFKLSITDLNYKITNSFLIIKKR
ncbi:MAG: T9SS type A sorting domain-containing protein [Cyclobacteriaceae bacterium]